ncbi:MAG: TetR/AcrR family transcriptional regulator [Actinobacteria bacterium]|nr:TetR/AcrR family transcriptional regulator [Actinomycetota bacterium]
MAVFRRRGFARTSIRDLAEATGLHPGSLYQAYGSKEGLFAAAVTTYNELVVEHRVRTHLDEAEPPLRGIDTFFASTFDDDGDDDSAADGPNPGCLLTNTAVEAHLLPGTSRDGVAAGLNLIEQGFQRVLERARQAGQINPTAATDQLAAQLLALYQGVLVLVRFGAPTTKLAAIVAHAVPAIIASGHHAEGST